MRQKKRIGVRLAMTVGCFLVSLATMAIGAGPYQATGIKIVERPNGTPTLTLRHHDVEGKVLFEDRLSAGAR